MTTKKTPEPKTPSKKHPPESPTTNDQTTPNTLTPTQALTPIVEAPEVYQAAKPQAWEQDPTIHNSAVDPATREAITRELLTVDSPAALRKLAEKYHVGIATVRECLLDYKQERETVSEVHSVKLLETIEGLQHLFAEALNKDKIANTGAKDLAIGLGILIDKAAQIRGKPVGDGGYKAKVVWRHNDGSEMGVEIR